MGMSAERFLKKVWKLNFGPDDYVALSSKGESGWNDYCYTREEAFEKIGRWLENHKNDDCYFCPLPFSGRRRSKNGVSHSRVLWSDIDTGDWKMDPPQILWESSPGRKQGLWILPEPIPAIAAAERSKQIAYKIGGDKGGWDVTQVLRIPGTKNYKYPDAPDVKLVWWKNSLYYNPLDRWRSIIPHDVLTKLTGPATVGSRSDVLWFLEHELLKLKIPREDVVTILKASEWNKYRGRDDEDERFEAEMQKHGAIDIEKPIIRDFTSIMEYAGEEEWLVEDYWMCESHGIVSAHPKSFKTTLVMDMLFSIATGLDFLGKKTKQGPVMFIQNENHARIIRRILIDVAHNKNIDNLVNTGECEILSRTPPRIRLKAGTFTAPMYEFIQPSGFSFDNAASLVPLEEAIDRIRPLVVTLDPLYLMMGGKDMNSAMDLNPVLNWCLKMRNVYKCSVILIHHNSKASESQFGGQRMLGSTTLHGWIDSAWYITPISKIDCTVKIEREFRAADSSGAPIVIQVYKDRKYCPSIVEKRDSGDTDLDEILAALSNGPQSMRAITMKCSWNYRKKTKEVLEKAEKEGYVSEMRNRTWKLN